MPRGRYVHTDLLSSWTWYVANGHSYGYYYDDKPGGLAITPRPRPRLHLPIARTTTLVYNSASITSLPVLLSISTSTCYRWGPSVASGEIHPRGGHPDPRRSPPHTCGCPDAVLQLQGLTPAHSTTLKCTFDTGRCSTMSICEVRDPAAPEDQTHCSDSRSSPSTRCLLPRGAPCHVSRRDGHPEGRIGPNREPQPKTSRVLRVCGKVSTPRAGWASATGHTAMN